MDEQSQDDLTGMLYNRFISYLSESKVDLYNVLVVLEILKIEIMEQIRKRHGLIE